MVPCIFRFSDFQISDLYQVAGSKYQVLFLLYKPIIIEHHFDFSSEIQMNQSFEFYITHN
jgi:hypothetical protein